MLSDKRDWEGIELWGLSTCTIITEVTLPRKVCDLQLNKDQVVEGVERPRLHRESFVAVTC